MRNEHLEVGAGSWSCRSLAGRLCPGSSWALSPGLSLPPLCFSKEQHDRLLVLYPSTLVIVSEEHNAFYFKVGSFANLFSLPPQPTAAISARPQLFVPLHPAFPALPVLARALPPRCSLASWQASRQRDVASHLPMRNTLPSYKSPGGKEVAAKALGGGGWRAPGRPCRRLPEPLSAALLGSEEHGSCICMACGVSP